MAVRAGIAWLSSSSAEILRARAVLHALRTPGVIDELGFLMLNGAFAERLYPGVTTLMTRARYLVFIPAIYGFLEKSKSSPGRDVDKLARDIQHDLRNALEKNERSFIGRESGRNLIRTASNIYWTALSSLGIATQRISEATYQQRISAGDFGLHAYRDDDRVAHDEESSSLWSSDLAIGKVLRDGGFPESTDFRLKTREATYLKTRYGALRPGGYENMVARMIAIGEEKGSEVLDGIDYPWDVPGHSQAVVSIVDHARRLSLLARGTTLQYYGLVLEKRRESDAAVEAAFIEWWDAARDDLSTWNRTAFFSLMLGWQAGRSVHDQRFINSWVDRCLAAKSGRESFRDRLAQEAIRRREDTVRPGKQRLRVKHQLDSWKLPQVAGGIPYLMDYRHRVGRQIARDIVEGLRGEPA